MEINGRKVIEKMAEMENTLTQTILANGKSPKLWNLMECSKFIKVYSPKANENDTKRKKMPLSYKRLSRRRAAVRRRQRLKVMKIMEELSNKNTPIVHEPDSSIDVEEFIQYPSDIIDSNNLSQNIEDISQNCIKIKEEYSGTYNQINILETKTYNMIEMEQLQNYTVKEELPEDHNETKTEQLQNCKEMKTEYLRNCEEMEIKQFQKYEERTTKQLTSCKEVKTEETENCEEIEQVSLKDDYKIEIMQLQNYNETEKTKNYTQKDKLDGRCIVNFTHLLNEIHRTFDNHAQGVECQFKDWKHINTYRYGLLTKFIFKCQMCNYVDTIWSEPKETNELDVNTAAITAGLEVGMGFTKLKRFCTKLNISCMSDKTYVKYRNVLDRKDESTND